MKSLLCILITVASAVAADLPNPTLTPGAVLTTDTKVICKDGYTKTVRNVPQETKNKVFSSYGIRKHAPGEYEVDHLISLELGGSNDESNLWPQSYKTSPWNAHIKDHLENTAHALVCSGKMALSDAQKEIASDWISMYKRIVNSKKELSK